jgi:2',3'-cyclic-nucleotide 2'-phosphodiesterase (5'-nucleotidase family)
MQMRTAGAFFTQGYFPHIVARLAIGAIACYFAAFNGISRLAMAGDSVTILLSADSEGHVGPCQDCPYHSGLGGLVRRARLVAQLRNEHPSCLLTDAGNAMVGSESLECRGKVIVAAYNALGYDAVNLCHRDFWFGKAETLALLKGAKFAVVSANLLDEKKGEPLVQPYLVKEIGGQRIAIIGVAQAPAGLDFLPHLKEHLAGIRIQPPVEALAKWLPKAKAESDMVILLYYGSASGLEPIQEKFGRELTAILVGGIRPEQLPPDSKPPLIGTSNHGRHLARIRLTGSSSESKLEVTQIAIEPTIKPDAEMEKVLAPFTKTAER